jgi:predicted nucleic acid-binding protein
MIRFLDSSSFVKMFLDELASSVLRDSLRNYADDSKAIATLAQVEVRSAIQRRFRNRQLTSKALALALSDLEEITTLWVRVPMDDLVIERASGVIARHALRSLDALQLASALVLREELDNGEGILFIASDKKLLAAAAAEGLTTWDPETSATPPIPPVN